MLILQPPAYSNSPGQLGMEIDALEKSGTLKIMWIAFIKFTPKEEISRG
jgi:hypothetical protein